MATASDPAKALERALQRRAALLADERITACRLLSGPFEGVEGLYVDRYDRAAVINLYQPGTVDITRLAGLLREQLDLRAVYVKHFVRDRSRLGGRFERKLRDPTPLLGEPMPEAIVVREYDCRFEVHLYDGFSTGLFLDQRENRRFLGRDMAGKRVLNLFAYTCGFSVACALGGAVVTSVDISKNYLDWARRNFKQNGLEPDAHYFTRADALEFLRFAAKRDLTFDLVVLDPPSFSAGRKGRSFSAVKDYPSLLTHAAAAVGPGGRIFASTNNTALATGKTFDDMIAAALGRRWRRLDLPGPAIDFSLERDRLACRLLTKS